MNYRVGVMTGNGCVETVIGGTSDRNEAQKAAFPLIREWLNTHRMEHIELRQGNTYDMPTDDPISPPQLRR